VKPLLYQSKPLQQSGGSYLRPGGAQISKRILELTRPKFSDRIGDIGCGRGTTLQLLHEQGFRQLFGIDRHSDFLEAQAGKEINYTCGDMSSLPYREASLDLLICECSWNLSEKSCSLQEFARVLKPGGMLALADIFLQTVPEGEWPIESCLASACTLRETQELVGHAGFYTLHFENHSHLLNQAAAEWIFAHGSLGEFWFAVTGNRCASQSLCSMTAASKPGLFILIGKRNHG